MRPLLTGHTRIRRSPAKNEGLDAAPVLASPARLRSGDVLLIVDVQNDFLPGGRLPVPGGDGVIIPLNRAIARFLARGMPIIATRDWHPPNHCSFLAHGGEWPPHCIRATAGAEFAAGLDLPPAARVIDKAKEPEREALSAFAESGFDRLLRTWQVRRLFVGGLATDYCVRATVLDALEQGYEVAILLDAVRAVDREPGDGDRSIQEMTRAGARTLRTEAIDR